MGVITLILYLGVVALWAWYLYRVLIAGTGSSADRRQLIILTVLVVLLTGLRLYF